MAGPLLLADTPHLLYRAFFALPDSITDGDGNAVNALLGSVNQLLWCEERFKPRAIVCCFGQESAAYRTEVLAAYDALLARYDEVEDDIDDALAELGGRESYLLELWPRAGNRP